SSRSSPRCASRVAKLRPSTSASSRCPSRSSCRRAPPPRSSPSVASPAGSPTPASNARAASCSARARASYRGPDRPRLLARVVLFLVFAFFFEARLGVVVVGAVVGLLFLFFFLFFFFLFGLFAVGARVLHVDARFAEVRLEELEELVDVVAA